MVIIENISEVIESTPPEIVADIYERGIVLSGGSVLLNGFDQLIRKEIKLPVHLAEEPATAVIHGLGFVLEDFNNLKEVIIPSARD